MIHETAHMAYLLHESVSMMGQGDSVPPRGLVREMVLFSQDPQPSAARSWAPVPNGGRSASARTSHPRPLDGTQHHFDDGTAGMLSQHELWPLWIHTRSTR